MRKNQKLLLVTMLLAGAMLNVSISNMMMDNALKKSSGNVIVSAVAEAKPEVKPEKKYFDCALSSSIQDYMFDSCNTYGTDPALLVAIMQKESNFTTSKISSTNDYGLCQINACHKQSLAKYGITNLLDPYQNIHAANIILSGLNSTFSNMEEVAIGYNVGTGGAQSLIKRGITSTYYSREVMKNYQTYKVQHVREEQ